MDFSVDVSNINLQGSKTEDIRLYFNYWCEESEQFYGFGESFTYFNLKGQRIPIVVSEQGVGRGLEPITDYFNENIAEGSGGSPLTTYAPKPIYITNLNRSMLFDVNVISFINLTSLTEVDVEVWTTSLNGVIFNGDSWLNLIELVTVETGRQPGK